MENRANFLMITADQHRADALGCAGKFDVRTPNIDRLAKRGTRFENAFTPLPVCAPSRQSMLCGQNPDSYGAFWNFGFFDCASLAPGGYWPEGLAKAGYSTAFVGKWGASSDFGPEDFGYGRCVSMSDYERATAELRRGTDKNFSWFGRTSPLPLEASKTHWLAQRAADFVREFSKEKAPWHIRLDFTDPHLPCEVCEPFASMYAPGDILPWDGMGDSLENKPYIQRQQVLNWGLENMSFEDWREPVARYYGMVSQLDDAVGIVLGALEESGGLGNTVVLYTSDHGDMCGSHGMLDKHYCLYDDLVKVPYIMAGPGIRQGAVREEFISLGLDLPPTADELFGLKSPPAQGVSIAPLLRGEKPEDWREYINASSNGQQFGFFNQRMLRDRRYKYIWNFTDIDEFYDLAEDPGEKKNLIFEPEHRAAVSRMRRELLKILRAQGDMFLKGSWIERQLSEDRKA